MKIRSDFVTNSSSASFILELTFETNNGDSAYMDLAVSPEVCFSDDGPMGGDDICLYPRQAESDITVDGQSIYSAKDIDALCDLLFGAATIYGWQDGEDDGDMEELTFVVSGKLNYYENREMLVEYIEDMGGRVTGSVSSKTDYLICNDKESTSSKNKKARDLGIPILTEVEFMKKFDYDSYQDYLDSSCEDEDEEGVAVKDVAPVTVGYFKEACTKAGITLDNLKTITVSNSKFGSGDSAMFIRSQNPQFAAFRKKYAEAAEDEKAGIIEELIAFVKSEPELEVHDNGYHLPGRMCCVWNANDKQLRKQMTAYLVEGKDGYWMGTYADVYTIDVTGKTVTNREVLYFGDM